MECLPNEPQSLQAGLENCSVYSDCAESDHESRGNDCNDSGSKAIDLQQTDDGRTKDLVNGNCSSHDLPPDETVHPSVASDLSVGMNAATEERRKYPPAVSVQKRAANTKCENPNPKLPKYNLRVAEGHSLNAARKPLARGYEKAGALRKTLHYTEPSAGAAQAGRPLPQSPFDFRKGPYDAPGNVLDTKLALHESLSALSMYIGCQKQVNVIGCISVIEKPGKTVPASPMMVGIWDKSRPGSPPTVVTGLFPALQKGDIVLLRNFTVCTAQSFLPYLRQTDPRIYFACGGRMMDGSVPYAGKLSAKKNAQSW
ncbi:hypothetical protein T440DRAFT_512029 [Plenodomus tracheiphilus IPT5]|uniref:Uncharacterized protein n=1 Tax=Plenodomus tracheiphilus IPT5 TaxID=1408161 RepID=A0A6A7APT8_9PLEO|nr:hypothetical protein T440DRAFT_512029 [Plenodomus tracheiphilus IPT5]